MPPADSLTQPPITRTLTRFAWLLIPLTGLAVYSNSCSGPFIFDDFDAITRNPSIKSLWSALRPPSDLPVSGRPVVSLLFAANYALHGFQVFGYHALNVVLHLMCGLALYGLTWRTLTLAGTAALAAQSRLLALFITLIWLLHPLQTEAVTYITQRTELTVSLFLLLTLYCLARAAQSAAKNMSLKWQVLAAVSCALGMASKEVMVVAPLLALLYDRTFIARTFKQALATRWPLHLALWGTLVILAALLATNPRSQSAAIGGFRELTTQQYFLMQLEIVPHYIRLAFWPDLLVLDYADWPIRTSFTQVWPSALAIILIAGLGIYAFIRNHWLGFLAAWFFAILAPTSSILVIASEVAAERRMYLPLAALVTALVIGVWFLIQRAQRESTTNKTIQRALFTGLAGLCVVLAVAAFARNAVYASDFAVWSDALAKRPGNARAMLHLATLYRDRGAALRKQGDEAAARHDRELAYDFVQRALTAMPTNAFAHNILADLLAKDGRHDEALVHFLETVRYRPNEVEARTQAIILLIERGRHDEARTQVDATLAIEPENYVALRSLGILHVLKNDLRGAIAAFERSLRGANSRNRQIEARLNIAIAYQQLGQAAETINQLNEILRIDPGNGEARRLLAQLGPAGTATP